MVRNKASSMLTYRLRPAFEGIAHHMTEKEINKNPRHLQYPSFAMSKYHSD